MATEQDIQGILDPGWVSMDSKYTSRGDIVSSLIGGTVATAVDAGASIWNSLVPEKYEASTEDLLARIDDNALKIYQENPDTIHTASFFAGAVAPIGLAMKGMNLLRSGAKGINWFSEAGKVAQMEKVNAALKIGGVETAAYREASRSLYLQNLGNVVVDNAAAELAIMGTLNAHPYMEDYMQDPIKSFAVGTVLGTAIFAPFSHIGVRGDLRREASKVYEGVFNKIGEYTRDVDLTANAGIQISQHQINIDNYTELLRKPDTDALTKAFLSHYIDTTKGYQAQVFNNIAEGALKDITGEERVYFLDLIKNNPDKFGAINKIQFATVKEEASFLKGTFGRLTEKPKGEIPFTKLDKNNELAPDTLVYSPRFRAFFPKKDWDLYGTSADLVSSEKQLLKEVPKNWHLLPRYDASLELEALSAAGVEKEFLKQMVAVDKMSISDIKAMKIAPDDAPTINAVLAKIQKLKAEKPEEAADLAVTLTNAKPNWVAIEARMAQDIPLRNAARTADGVAPDYLTRAQELTLGKNLEQFNLLNTSNSGNSTVSSILYGWTRSFAAQGTVNNKFFDAFTTGGGATVKYGTTQAEIDVIKAGYNSAASVAYRQKLAELADSQGNVYLYRGLRQTPMTHRIVESYTIFPEKAAEFGGGNVKLFKVKVNDVYGVIHDTVVGAAGSKKSTEILVLASAKEELAKIPHATEAITVPKEFLDPAHWGITTPSIQEKIQYKNLAHNLFYEFHDMKPMASSGLVKEEWEKELNTFIKTGLEQYQQDLAKSKTIIKEGTTSADNMAGPAELHEALMAWQESQVKSMLAKGVPAETVSMRTNLSLDAVHQISSGTSIKDIQGELSAITNPEMVGSFIGNQNRSLAVSTTRAKIPAAEIRANLISKHVIGLDKETQRLLIETSSSPMARTIGEFLYSPNKKINDQMLADSLDLVNPATVGNRVFQSLDFATRDMGIAGQLLTQAGKDAEKLKKQFSTEVLTPVTRNFEAIIKDPVALTEFHRAKNAHASIAGYREYKDRQWWVQDKTAPWKLDADGKALLDASGNKIPNMIEAEYNGAKFRVTSDVVDKTITDMVRVGRDLMGFNNTQRQLYGMPPIPTIGDWIPAFNVRDKFRSYVFDGSTKTTRLLWGYTEEELQSAEKAFMAKLKPEESRFVKIVRAGEDQKLFNMIEAREENLFPIMADVGKYHSGSSALALEDTGTAVFSELAKSYEHYTNRIVENYLEAHYHSVFEKFDRLERQVGSITNQNAGDLAKAISAKTNVGTLAKNALLGRSDLGQFVGWQKTQNGMVLAAEVGIKAIRNVFEPILSPAKGFFGKGKGASDAEWELKNQALIDAGVTPPWAGIDEIVAKERFHVEKMQQIPGQTARLVSLSNGLAATMLLKIGELGQPLVNLLSMPVLTSAAVQQQFAKEFMGAPLAENFRFGTYKAILGGIRFQGNPLYLPHREFAKSMHLFEPVVSEATELMALQRKFDPSLTQKLENAMESKTVEWLSTFSNKGEHISREVAFSTGIYLGRQAYPTLGEAGLNTFARSFMDTVIGNYAASQRPSMFQGTVGTAMGLFQTYMVTIMQQIYRKAELRDFSGLAKMALIQGGLFGAKSLPGFNYVSEQIGTHFSDQNYDLTTGAYRATGDALADVILYGLPSNLGPAVYTRGDIAPRVPTGFGELAAVNILGSAYQAGGRLVQAAKEVGDPGTSMALMEALSLQSISRPVARLSELVTGYGVTGQGNQVAGPEEIYSVPGWAARIFATRSLEEAKAREALHLKNLYGSLDRDQRQSALASMRNHIRSGTLTSDVAERIQEKYMRTGSPTGWRSMVNQALRDTDSPGVSAVRNHLKPSAPFNLMIDDID